MVQDISPAEIRPRFCPRCKRGGPAEATLCPACGDPLEEQGFCEVCESFWLRPAGATCPKHDLALSEGPEETTPALPDGERIDWVTVGSFVHPVEAETRRLRLEAEGIPTFLDGARMGTNAIYSVATGGIKLQVPRPLVADARVLLAQSWSVPTADDDLDDAWEELAPEPSADVPAALWRIGLVPLVILLALGAYLIYLKS